MPTALITGVTGQDGSYLAEFLLEQGYKVVGMVRRTSTLKFERIHHIQDKIEIVQGDLLDQMSLIGLLQEYEPDEVYNLAAQSFVPTSFTQPVLTVSPEASKSNLTPALMPRVLTPSPFRSRTIGLANIVVICCVLRLGACVARDTLKAAVCAVVRALMLALVRLLNCAVVSAANVLVVRALTTVVGMLLSWAVVSAAI